MVINARPGKVSHGLETIVPFQRKESLYQRLLEMTNINVNAGNLFRPMRTPSNAWDEHLDEFNDENFTPQNSYPGYYQNTSSFPEPQAGIFQKSPLCLVQHQGQYNSQIETLNYHSMHQGQAIALNREETQSSMLPNDYSHEYPGQRHSSFAGSPIINQEVERVAYHNVNESTLMPFTAAVSGSSGKDDVPIISDFNFGATSPPTIYSVNSVSSATVDPMTLVKVNTPIDQNDMMKDLWWPENLGGDQSEYHDDVCGLSMLYDGLPRIQTQQQQHYSDLWVTNNSSSCGWTAQSSTTAAAIAPITMSPKALTLSASTAPVLSFESSRGLVLLPTGLSSASSLVSSCRQDTPESVPEILQVVEPPPLGAFRRHRQILPECLPQSCNASILPSNESTSRDTTQKRTVKSKPRSCSFRNLSPPARGKLRLLFASTHSQKADVTDVETLWPRRIEPKRAAASSSPSAQAEHHRNARDDFLIKSKLAGMSYKDIRRQGNFSEAESTLRGRFRTLTKHKTARVRKPEWSDNDVRLLKKAVRKLTSGSDIAKGKVPWKLVAEYIANNGGSYHFGNATCRKRWDELPVKVRS